MLGHTGQGGCHLGSCSQGDRQVGAALSIHPTIRTQNRGPPPSSAVTTSSLTCDQVHGRVPLAVPEPGLCVGQAYKHSMTEPQAPRCLGALVGVPAGDSELMPPFLEAPWQWLCEDDAVLIRSVSSVGHLIAAH